MSDTQDTQQKCPHCSYDFRQHFQSFQAPIRLLPGRSGYFVCPCLAVIRFDNNLMIHAVTEEERAAIDVEQMVVLNNARRMLRQGFSGQGARS